MAWPSARGIANTGATALPARGLAPQVVSEWTTGADIRQVVEYRLPSGEPAALVVAGSCLQALRWTGETIFRADRDVITRILHVAETPTGPIALVASREDRVLLLDLTTGRPGWTYCAPPGTRLSGAGSSRLFPADGALCWLIAPSYDETVTLFEIESADAVRERWTHDFAGRFDRGFGPVLIATDVLGTGSRQIVLSSRTGANYRAY
jgi:hypothetical protein